MDYKILDFSCPTLYEWGMEGHCKGLGSSTINKRQDFGSELLLPSRPLHETVREYCRVYIILVL